MTARPDLAALPPVEVVAMMTGDELRMLLAHLAAHEQQLAALHTAIAARLAEKPSQEPLWTAKQVAAYLGVGVDWVRDHGEEKGIALPLSSGTVRYVPERVRALRQMGTDAKAVCIA